ncbi:MAG: phosphate ABC transporter ATP-binding protein [Methanosarcinaceae archaeon]|nr:phosphate ABC transporter ATP-binding protein [Methanosarcinaceae archaeon]NKQ39277.1 phosphate ABC transporter ATP-binding protein [Methanosarcinales archaeon]
MPFIEVKNLCKTANSKPILKDVSFTIEKGDIFALIGPSGSGKTTIIRLLNLLDKPDSGKIFFDGIDIANKNNHTLDIRRKMIMLSQKPIVFNTSVYNNVAYGLKIRGEQKHIINSKVKDLLDAVMLSGFEKRNAKSLSGGEMQRIALARSLVIEPEFLLLDEPTANLDPKSTTIIEELILSTVNEKNTAILMATHDMRQVKKLCKNIGVVIDGELKQVESYDEILLQSLF